MFSPCCCEIPLGALISPTIFNLYLEAKLSKGVNVCLCGGMVICLGRFLNLWPKILG